MKVLWCHSHLVWLVFEVSIPTWTCFLSENFCDLFRLLFLSCHLGMVREKVAGEAEGKMHGQLFCSHKTKNHHKLSKIVHHTSLSMGV